MPALVEVQVARARDLPIMDKSSELTDAFAEVRFAGTPPQRTDVCSKSLNPVWSGQWFSFEVDNDTLQDEPLQIRVMDHDTYTAHDAIGKVYIPLGSFVGSSSSVCSWYPIFDTLYGIRGEVHVAVKLRVLDKQSSPLNVQFYASGSVPNGHVVSCVMGFLEELVVNNDPEYKWIDKIRTPRASNEARQRLFFKMLAELQRVMSQKAVVAGGNAIIGYRHCYDLEGESGIVVRGIGTCVVLTKPISLHHPYLTTPPNEKVVAEPESVSRDHVTLSGRRFRKTSSSDSDNLSSSPTKPGGLNPVMELSSHDNGGGGGLGGVAPPDVSHPLPPGGGSCSEFPFCTLTSLPEGVVTHFGGVVSARAVKLLDKINNPDDPETRDVWWNEVRTEVRSHAKALGCHTVLGYQETTSICDTLCLLSATGTAVCVNWSLMSSSTKLSLSSSIDKVASENLLGDVSGRCMACHIPYSTAKLPFKIQLTKCALCLRHLVPMVILSTADQPSELLTRGRPCLVQARVCQPKKKSSGENNAITVSKMLPFLEYGLHRRLLNKMKVKGMNAVFSLKMEMTVGESLVTGVATGTGVYLEALQRPELLCVSGLDSSLPLPEDQLRLNKFTEENRQYCKLDSPMGCANPTTLDVDSDEENELDLSWDRREPVVVDMDDKLKKEDIFDILSDASGPPGYHMINCPFTNEMSLPGSKVITSICRQSLDTKLNRDNQFSKLFCDTLKLMSFKLRRLTTPCTISMVDFNVDLPDDDLVQVTLTAAVIPLSSLRTTTLQQCTSHSVGSYDDDDVMFNMEGNITHIAMPTTHSPTAPLVAHTSPMHVTITPLPSLAGGESVRWLGVVGLFLIRETTSIRGLGGVDHFVHLFISEANAIARAHVAAMGGNALLGYRINECVLIDSPHKNQAQCLLHISGDAVHVDRMGGHHGSNVHSLAPTPPAADTAKLLDTSPRIHRPHTITPAQHQCTEC